ncbi:CPBP family intramembrane metalloprotease [Neobacillus notoginsengisoli]|uniref:CPBP family intramembrane metalloprotease n=1 Tax=Neobacillus notoginsengisoli TaxID=1578198 RepID=A0A417YQX4_9BACI|nr:CPBP family glutamic-type intramembrane protease [Neobacillus notoginsengisoli]RHW37235.1 CPBP family intramembrane metalloprotease [Neobacillus notoginsengisoli]
MIDDLTQPISKRLLLLLLLVTIGSEAALFLSRYSYFFSEVYQAIMIISIFVAWRLHPRLAGNEQRRLERHSGEREHLTEIDGTVPSSAPVNRQPFIRQMISQFAVVFLIFYLGAIVFNFYSAILFEDFNESYGDYMEESAVIMNESLRGVAEEGGAGSVANLIFEWFSLAGSDFYADILAGFEEVYRIAYIILFLMLFKKCFPKQWEKPNRDLFLMIALFLSSVLFGVGHALDTPQPWTVTIGTIATFTNLGLILGLLLLWTRNLWLLIAVHAIYDIFMSIEWYYFEFSSLIFAGLLLLAWAIETATRKTTPDLNPGLRVSD